MFKFITPNNILVISNILLIIGILYSTIMILLKNDLVIKLLYFIATLIMTSINWIILNAEFLAICSILSYSAIFISLLLILTIMLKFKDSFNLNKKVKLKRLNYKFITTVGSVLGFTLCLSYMIKDYMIIFSLSEINFDLNNFINHILERNDLLFIPIMMLFLGAVVIVITSNSDPYTIKNNHDSMLDQSTIKLLD